MIHLRLWQKLWIALSLGALIAIAALVWVFSPKFDSRPSKSEETTGQGLNQQDSRLPEPQISTDAALDQSSGVALGGELPNSKEDQAVHPSKAPNSSTKDDGIPHGFKSAPPDGILTSKSLSTYPPKAEGSANPLALLSESSGQKPAEPPPERGLDPTPAPIADPAPQTERPGQSDKKQTTQVTISLPSREAD